VGEIIQASGSVELKASSGDLWIRAAANNPICPGDTIRVGLLSKGAIILSKSGARWPE
jgi:hypothetical protein